MQAVVGQRRDILENRKQNTTKKVLAVLLLMLLMDQGQDQDPLEQRHSKLLTMFLIAAVLSKGC